VFWVISVYFNIRNTLAKSGRFLMGHPVYNIRPLRVKQNVNLLVCNDELFSDYM
jgi:hypothetical protein